LILQLHKSRRYAEQLSKKAVVILCIRGVQRRHWRRCWNTPPCWTYTYCDWRM